MSLTNRGFTGHEHLPAYGIINMNGRVYDPVLARFLSPDNFIQAPNNTQSFNRYSYVLNNPLKYTDPSGWKFTTWGTNRDYDDEKGVWNSALQNADRQMGITTGKYGTSANNRNVLMGDKGIIDERFDVKTGTWGYHDSKNPTVLIHPYYEYDANSSKWHVTGAHTKSIFHWIVTNDFFSLKTAEAIWNSPIARSIVPDVASLSYGVKGSNPGYYQAQRTFSLILRGKEKGLYFSKTQGLGVTTGVALEGEVSFSKGYYLGDPRKITSDLFGGIQYTGEVGIGAMEGIGAEISIGGDINDAGDFLNVTTAISGGIGFKIPIPVQGSVGASETYFVTPLIKR